MTDNTATLAAFSQAVTKSMNEALDKKFDMMEEKISNKFDNIKEELGQFKTDQTESLEATLKGGMDEILVKLSERQESFEAASDLKFKAFENSMNEKQDANEKKSEARLQVMESQLTSLNATVQHLPQLLKASQQPHIPSSPPNPAFLPQPHFPSATTAISAMRTAQTRSSEPTFNSDQLMTIRDIVSKAKYIVGLGPITADDIANALGDDHTEKVRAAVVTFTRMKLGITTDEIKDEDILHTFLPDDVNIPRVYAQFPSHAHADFFFDLIRTLRKPELKVVKFVPREFRARNRAIESEAFTLRKHTLPPFKTRIEYSDDDLVLTKCLHNHHTFVQHEASDLPPVDLGPQRPPPPGRKRGRQDENGSPNPADTKKDRIVSPVKTPEHALDNNTPASEADTLATGGQQQSLN